jgi:hypothetical protein
MKLFALLLANTFALNHARQLSTTNGDSLWIATVDDGYDCSTMSNLIKSITESHNNRRLMSDDIKIEEMKGDDDCFIEFSGTLDMAIAVNNTEGIIDVDPNNEIILNGYYWHLDRSDQDVLPLDKNAYSPSFTGAGQTVYIIDTGVFKEHNDFGGRASYGGDFVGESYLGDNNGHGTHTSSISAGTEHGIAPHANIVGVKVLSGGGSGSTSGVIKGIQWAVSDAGSRTSVLSMSLGGGKSTAMNKAVEDAAKKHIVVVAAGNENQDACNVSPASAGGDVVTVGSSTKEDYRSGFSNHGRCVDIFGPGSNIIAAYIGSTSTTRSLSGTSMATPYIAGIALQLLEKNEGSLSDTLNELYNTAVYGQLKGNIGSKSPNLLGLIPTYTGPPTPPTMKPTLPPTRPEPKLCLGSKCFKFKASKFGENIWYERDLIYDVAVPSSVLMCDNTNDDFTNKIVAVQRGSCLFFDKVKNCEQQGAKGVIIVNDIYSEIFEPAYYGQGKTKLPSCMISRSDGQVLFNSVGDELKWGRFDSTIPTHSPVPTTTVPTQRPTRHLRPCYSFKKRRCNNRKRRCRWNRTEKQCKDKN